MQFTLTQHAAQVVKERGIQIEWIERIFREPVRKETDKLDPTLEHWLGKVVEHDNRVLRVILNVHVDPLQVVTVYFDRKMRGKL